MYYYKTTKTNKGLVTSEHPLTEHPLEIVIKEIGGYNVEVRQQRADIEGMRFGFTAISPEARAKMELTKGDELPLTITDKPVRNSAGEIIPNLFWAH
jgi:hypothetical protein